MKKTTNIIGIIIGIALVLGTSFAIFRARDISDKKNEINAGRLALEIVNEQNEIKLENELPRNDSTGMETTPYTFDVRNRGTIDAGYSLYIEVNKESTIPTNKIKYALTKVEPEGEETIVTSHNSIGSITPYKDNLYKIDTDDLIEVDTLNSYKLYLWLDETITVDELANKTFKFNMKIEGKQIVNTGIVSEIDLSENGDGSVMARMYKDNSIVISGSGAMKSEIEEGTLMITNPEIIKVYKEATKLVGIPMPEDINDLNGVMEWVGSLTEAEQEKLNDNMNTAVDMSIYNSVFEELGLEKPVDSIENFDENKMYIIMYKKVLKDLGYTEYENIETFNDLLAYFQGKGMIDDEGQPIEENQEWKTIEEKFNELMEDVEEKIEEKHNSIQSETISPSSITIEEGITNIPRGLFTGNENITSITLPSTIKRIEDEAFEYCSNLESINLPNGLEYIGNKAFYSCYNLKSIVIPEGLTAINYETFQNCSSLEEVTIPKSITKIDSYAFAYCYNLKKANYNGTIADYCNIQFNYNSNPTNNSGELYINNQKITNINFASEGVTVIPQYAFQGNAGLTSIDLTGITSIGYQAFYGCTELTELNIPNEVNDINSTSFDGCTGITKLSYYANKSYYLSLPNVSELIIKGSGNLSNISFDKSYISKVSISDGISYISDSVFDECFNLSNIFVDDNNLNYSSVDGILYNKEKTKLLKYPANNSQTTITIDASINDIATDAFKDCNNLVNINVDTNNASYTSVDGILYNKDKTVLIRCPSANNLSTISVSDTVVSIYNFGFRNCSNLETVTLPNTITSIGERVFEYCTNLSSINIPDGITEIPSFAFNGCSSLPNISFPSNISYIRSYAFGECDSITELELPSNINYDTNAFYSCKGVKKLTIDVTKSKLGTFPNVEELHLTGTGSMYSYGLWDRPWGENVKSVIIDNTLTSISNSAFWNINSINSITIPNSIQFVDWGAFWSWSSSQTINIDNTSSYVSNNWNSNWNQDCYANINYLQN